MTENNGGSEELWRDIPGYEGLYQVSSLGQVRSVRKKGYLLHPVKSTNQYFIVNFYKNRHSKSFYIHMLVAEAFVPNPLHLPCVKHLDDNPKNNRADNLQWAAAFDDSASPDEIWRDVPHYEGLYQVSSYGNVRSFRRVASRGKLMNPSSNRPGSYLRVLLSKKDGSCTINVHVLVAQAFLPNPSHLPCVIHLDGDIKNNRVENLAWSTHWDDQSGTTSSDEIWRDVPGYEGLYQVSSLGNVKSLHKHGCIMIPAKVPGDYLLVALSNNKLVERFQVQILVAKAFLPNPLDLPCVVHIDGDVTNNKVENLRWAAPWDTNDCSSSEEVWRDVPGYEGIYQISSWGNINSSHNHSRILRPRKHSLGYLVVTLSKNRSKEVVRVHELVAQVFLPNPSNLPCVNHRDGDKSNNRVENLEWVSYCDSADYGTSYEVISRNMKGNNNNRKAVAERSRAVMQFSLNREYIATYDSLVAAARAVNGSPSGIGMCCKYKHETAYGFVWRYVDEQRGRTKSVAQVDENGNILRRFPSARQAAEEMNIPQLSIYSCCNGHSKTTHGMRFIFLPRSSNVSPETPAPQEADQLS